MIVRAAYLLAQNSFVERQQERYLDAEEKADEFIGRYDSGSYLKEVQTMLANTKKRLKQLEDVRYQNPGARTRS